MLVSKIKPCMSKYELSIVKPRMAHYNSHSLLDIFLYMDNCGNSTANTRIKAPTLWRGALVTSNRSVFGRLPSEIELFSWAHGLSTGAISFKCLPYQLSMVDYAPTMVVTGNGESGFDSGEGAWEMATTSKEGSRHANYPLPARGGSDEK